MHIMFRNISKSPMQLTTPEWQDAIVKRVRAEYTDAATEASEEFAKKVDEMCKKTLPAYYGEEIERLLFKSPRYAYISNIKTPFGDIYTAEIDLILHTVAFRFDRQCNDGED